MARLFREEVHPPRIRGRRERGHRTVPTRRQRARFAERRARRSAIPGERGEFGERVDLVGGAVAGREQRTAVRREGRRAPRMLIDGQPTRLGAIEADEPELRRGERIGRLVAVGAGDEYETRAVRRPLCVQRIPAIAAASREARRLHKLGVGQKIARLAGPARRGAAVGREVQHPQPRFAVLKPAVPIADREALVLPRVPLTRLTLGSDALVVGLEQCPRVVRAAEDELATVRRELRAARAVGQRRQPTRLAAAQLEEIKLVRLIALTLGREHEPRAIRAPGHPALAARRTRQPPRCLALARLHRDHPQVRDLRLQVVSGLRDRGDHPLPVRARHRRADPAHEPEVLVRDGAGGGNGCRRSGHGRRSCRSRCRARHGRRQHEPCDTCP